MMADNIQGLAELNQSFKQLGDNIVRRVGIRMVASGAGVIKKGAKTAAQAKGLVRSGALVNNIAAKREKQVPPDTIQYNIGVRHGRALGNGKKVVKYLALSKSGRVVTKRKNDPFYWRFLNLGTKYIAGAHFIEAGLTSSSQQAIDKMSSVLDDELAKAQK